MRSDTWNDIGRSDDDETGKCDTIGDLIEGKVGAPGLESVGDGDLCDGNSSFASQRVTARDEYHGRLLADLPREQPIDVVRDARDGEIGEAGAYGADRITGWLNADSVAAPRAQGVGEQPSPGRRPQRDGQRPSTLTGTCRDDEPVELSKQTPRARNECLPGSGQAHRTSRAGEQADTQAAFGPCYRA